MCLRIMGNAYVCFYGNIMTLRTLKERKRKREREEWEIVSHVGRSHDHGQLLFHNLKLIDLTWAKLRHTTAAPFSVS